MRRLCETKDEVIAALPLVREALAIGTAATIDCTANSLTLTIQVDMATILRMIEAAQK
jgi:hypothetical protein